MGGIGEMGELAPTPATFPASCTLASGGTPSGEESSPCEADGDAALRASLQEPLSLARVTQPAEAPPEQACRKRAYNSPFNIVLRANRPRCSLLLRSPSDTAEEPVPRAVKRKVSRNKRTRPAASRGVPRVRSEDASAELGSLDEQAVWSQTQRQNSEECRTTPEGPASSQCPTPPVEIAAFAKGLRWHQSSRRAASLLTKTECAPLPVCESSSFLPFEGCAEGLSSGGPPSVRETVSPAPNEKSLAAADAQPAERSTCASFVEPLRAPTLAELIDFVSFRADKGTAAPSRPDGDLPIVKRRERGGTFFFLKPKPDASLCAARLLATALLTHPGGLFDIFADVEDKIPSAFSECREARASEDSAHGAEEEGASVFACGRLSSSDQEGDEELFVREVHLLRGGLGKAVRLRLERGLALLLAQTPSLLRFLGEVCAFCKAKTNAKEEAFPAALGRSISLLGSETSLSRSADALWLLHSLLHHAKGEKNPSQQETLAQQGCRLLDAAFSERERGFAALALGLCGSRWKRQLRDRLSSDAPLTADKQTETQNLDCEDAPQRLALERLLRLPDGKDSIPDLASASEKQKVALAVAAAAAAGQRVISVQRVGRAVAFKRFSPPLFSFCNASEPPPAEQQQVARGEETSASLNSESFSEEAAVDKKPPTSQPSQQALENSFAQTLFPGLLIRVSRGNRKREKPQLPSDVSEASRLPRSCLPLRLSAFLRPDGRQTSSSVRLSDCARRTIRNRHSKKALR